MDIEVFEQLETIAKSDSNEERIMLKQFQKKDSYKELGIINQKIIEMEKDENELSEKDKYWQQKKIRARFVCALSICYLDKKIALVIGKVEGYISDRPKDRNGFGYDPIFIPKNKKKTFAEISPTYKYKLDHRSKAFKKIKKFL